MRTYYTDLAHIDFRRALGKIQSQRYPEEFYNLVNVIKTNKQTKNIHIICTNVNIPYLTGYVEGLVVLEGVKIICYCCTVSLYKYPTFVPVHPVYRYFTK